MKLWRAAAILGAAVLLAAWGAYSLLNPGMDREGARRAAEDSAAVPGHLEPASETIEAGAISVRRAAGSGLASLRIDEAWLARHGQPILAQVRVVCRYVPSRDQWQRLPASPTRIAYRMEPLSAADTRVDDRTFFELPREPGLYWVHWIEQGEGDHSQSAVAQRHELVSAGPVPCHDLARDSVPAGKVPACVPFADRAEARVVPDPGIACADLR